METVPSAVGRPAIRKVVVRLAPGLFRGRFARDPEAFRDMLDETATRLKPAPPGPAVAAGSGARP